MNVFGSTRTQRVLQPAEQTGLERGAIRQKVSPAEALQRALHAPATLTPAHLHALQRSVGNHATAGLMTARQTPVVQRKLQVGAVDDPLERQAESIAQRVTAESTLRQRPEPIDIPNAGGKGARPVVRAAPLSSPLPSSGVGQRSALIQRAPGLPSAKEFQKEAGRAGFHFGSGKSSFGLILQDLIDFRKLDDQDTTGQLTKMKDLRLHIQFWTNSVQRLKNKKGDPKKQLALGQLAQTLEQKTAALTESLIPQTQDELNEIATRSKYKNLRKVGGDRDLSSTTYHREFVSSKNFVKSPVRNEVKNINKALQDFKLFHMKERLAKTEDEMREMQQHRDTSRDNALLSETRFQDSGIKVRYENGLVDMDESQFDSFKVDYLTGEKERGRYEVQVEGGRLFQNGSPFGTDLSFTWFSGRGTAIYVMDPNGRLFAGPHKVGQFHHSSFLGGGAVAGAGEMKVNNGVLEEINNKSGHYQPGPAEMFQVLQQLESQGVDLNGVALRLLPRMELYSGGAKKFLEDNQGMY